MTGRRTKRALGVVVVTVAAIAVITAVAAATPGGSVLVVANADTGEHLLTTPVEEGTPVMLNYTHSVEKTPVHDIYRVHNGSLEMTRMEFQSYGWGLPARATVTREGEWFVFDPPGVYDEIYVQPGRVAGHHLRVGDEHYDLVALSDANGVRISVEHRSVLTATLDEFN